MDPEALKKRLQDDMQARARAAEKRIIDWLVAELEEQASCPESYRAPGSYWETVEHGVRAMLLKTLGHCEVI
jgi:hypothetical protein